MDVGVVGEEALLGGVEEVGAVVDAGLFAGGAAEDFGTPGVAGWGVGLLVGLWDGRGVMELEVGYYVQMAVKVDDGYGAVFAVDGAEEGEGDGVVTS